MKPIYKQKLNFLKVHYLFKYVKKKKEDLWNIFRSQNGKPTSPKNHSTGQ